MAAHREQFAVKVMAGVLAVSASGFYRWRTRGASARERANRELRTTIRAIHADSRSTYGVRRVHAALGQRQVVCNRKRVARLMRLDGLQGRGRGHRRPRTTASDPTLAVAPNLLARDFR